MQNQINCVPFVGKVLRQRLQNIQQNEQTARRAFRALAERRRMGGLCLSRVIDRAFRALAKRRRPPGGQAGGPGGARKSERICGG
jgi:hypothetical protein